MSDAGADADSDADAERGETRAEQERGEGRGRPCPACGASMHRRHCKYVCPRHGVVYDCSDTFY